MLHYFEEEQRFGQWWIWMAPVTIFLITGYITIQQLVYGNPVGNNPMADKDLWIPWLFTLAMFWLIWSVELITVIDASGIHLRFRPFIRKHISWQDIDRIYLRKYKPIREYGGYGIRLSKRGNAYNIKGNEGIQLELKNGKKLLIGTQRWSDLEKVISKVQELHL